MLRIVFCRNRGFVYKVANSQVFSGTIQSQCGCLFAELEAMLGNNESTEDLKRSLVVLAVMLLYV